MEIILDVLIFTHAIHVKLSSIINLNFVIFFLISKTMNLVLYCVLTLCVPEM